MDVMDIMDIRDIIDIKDIMVIMDIMVMMDIIIITAWMAMAGAVLTLVAFDAQQKIDFLKKIVKYFLV